MFKFAMLISTLAALAISCTTTNKNKTNPLISGSNLEHKTFAWDKIKPEHVVPAMKSSIKLAEQRIEKIINNPEEPNFENTVAALEFVAPELEYTAGAYYGLRGLLQNEYNPIGKEAQELMTKYSSKLSSNKPLFARIEKVYKKRRSLKLSSSKSRMLEELYTQYVREGVNQPQEVLDKVNKIKEQIAQLSNKFRENGTKSKETFEVHITDAKDLKGLPKQLKDRAAKRAKDKKKKGWIITLDISDYIDVVKQSANADLRRKLWSARRMTAYKSGPTGKNPEFDNRQIVLDIVRLRQEKAKILGFKNHAEYALQDKMAESPERVLKFMDDFLVQIKPQAKKELQKLKIYHQKKTGSSKVNPWDISFISHNYKKENLGVDNEKIRQYFPLMQVLKDGAMRQGKLFWDIEFTERKDLPVYHPDVMAYEVKIKDKTIGLMYFDLYARKGKRGGAWVNPLRTHHYKNGKEVLPIIMLVLNVSKATNNEPSLLSIDQATTVFHEMGHAYHSLLSKMEYPSQNNVAWDFVEVPSQVPENLVFEKPILELFARHYKTGKVIPDELIAQVKADKNYNVASFELRQMSLAYMDMGWYTAKSLPALKDMRKFEKASAKKTILIPTDVDGLFSANFGHIFAGGYHAGYYGYQWARVIGADLYAAYTEKGPFSLPHAIKVSKRFRDEILSQGNKASALQLFKNFRNGREPDPKHFLKMLK